MQAKSVDDYFVDGIPMPKSGVHLPWGAFAETLTSLGRPTVHLDGKQKLITWEAEPVIPSLLCTVTAKLYPNQHLRDVELGPLMSEDCYNARDQFSRVQEKLIAAFGEPTKEEESLGAPFASWSQSGVELSHFIFDRFGEYCILRLKRRGRLE